MKGFSLLEVVISVSIIGIIIVSVASLPRDVFFFNSVITSNLSVEQEGRKVLRPMVNELRGASPSSTGTYPIETASSTAITFYADINNNGNKERIRYFVQGNTLKRGVVYPSGTPLSYSTTTESVSNLITDLAATSSIFYYYDSQYTGTSSPLTTPPPITQIRLVKISIPIDKNGPRPPSTVIVTSQVSIRNLKDNY
jgi:prepilin-type N-terminal cleavage/methylation domain-containing protein